MIAYINGIMVQGSPEEIERYRQITAEKKTHTGFFNITDDIPQHVKEYGKHRNTYVAIDTKTRAWF